MKIFKYPSCLKNVQVKLVHLLNFNFNSLLNVTLIKSICCAFMILSYWHSVILIVLSVVTVIWRQKRKLTHIGSFNEYFH